MENPYVVKYFLRPIKYIAVFTAGYSVAKGHNLDVLTSLFWATMAQLTEKASTTPIEEVKKISSITHTSTDLTDRLVTPKTNKVGDTYS